MSGPPAQGYKISGEGVAGGGSDGTAGGNTSQPYPGNSQNQSSGPQQEIAGTLPNNYSLGATKAESKGEDRQPIHSHDEDIPATAPHDSIQSNEGSKPPNGPAKST